MIRLLGSAAATAGFAAALATTLPRLGLAWLALPATAGLLWTWRQRDPRRCAGLGLLAGMVYFTVAYRWFGETAGAELGPWAPLIVLGPALLSAWTFALAAWGQWLARRCLPSALAPPVAALAFAVADGLRGVGPLANPFASIAYPQVDTAFGAIAPFLGAGGVTFAVVCASGYLADLLDRPTRPRAPAIGLGLVAAVLLAATLLAPARVVPPATTPVAVVQGNIRQSLKWEPGALDLAVGRYVGLTAGIRAASPDDARRPRFVVWPETVVPTDLAAAPALREQLRRLAGETNTTLIVGALERSRGTPYNALWFIDRDGVERVYRKRALVPFAETLPGEPLLGRIPITRLISRFGAGTEDAVVPIADRRVAPLICWETEFPQLIGRQVRRGADVLVVATDDAWFGATDGPYQHAQIAQMRALETGRWVVRAASTGVSGVIAPDGRYARRSVLDTVAVVQGAVGAAVDTPFDRVGALPLLGGAAALYVLAVAFGARARRRAGRA